MPPELKDVRNERLGDTTRPTGRPTSEDVRTDSQHDRDRILYSSAFRRLGSVTQVASTTEVHLLHNRLTHSLKVAQIGRRLAERLVQEATKEQLLAVGWIDPDVVESACLAHDLGHPPFGHIAEEELQHCLKNGGLDLFEGNAQSFRIVTKLAVRVDPSVGRGLNLTRATLRALLKYPWLYNAKDKLPKSKTKWGAYYSDKDELARTLNGQVGKSAEAALMDWADDVTYAVHDLEDFYRAGLIPLDQLADDGPDRQDFVRYVVGKRSESSSKTKDELTTEVKALLGILDSGFPLAPFKNRATHQARLHAMGSQMITKYCNAVVWDGNRLKFGPDEEDELALLKELTWFYVIDNPSTGTLQHGQRKVVRTLFRQLRLLVRAAQETRREEWRLPRQLHDFLDLDLIGEASREAASGNEDAIACRAIADYIATLTEHQAYDLYGRLSGNPIASSALDSWLRN